MKRKKICIITGGHWSAVMGGAQYQVKCILDELLKDQQFEVFYLAREINPNYKPENYHIRQISKPSRVRRISFLFDYRKLTKNLEAIGPDVIYQRGLQPYTGVAAHYSTQNNCEFIFHVASDIDVQPNRYFNNSRLSFITKAENKLAAYGLKHATKIITQTQCQYDLLKCNYGITADTIMPNFHPKPAERIIKNEKPIKIVWVANFKPIKQPEYFVKLAEDMQSYRDLEFIMIGRSGSINKYGELHKKIKTIQNLKYLNELPIEEVNKILADAHIFVNTSQVEGFANTFIQAWMRKVPVLSLSINTDNVFDDGKVGFCAGDYKGLKEHLITLIENSELRMKMGEDAQLHAYKHHSSSNANKLLSILR